MDTPKEYVRFVIVHSVLGGASEKNFQLTLTVKQLKDKVM